MPTQIRWCPSSRSRRNNQDVFVGLRSAVRPKPVAIPSNLIQPYPRSVKGQTRASNKLEHAFQSASCLPRDSFFSSFHQTGPFGYNEEVEIRVDFSLPVSVPEAEEAASATTTEELPALSVVMGSTSTALTTTYLTAAAVYTDEDLSGTGAANALFFKYLVAADDESTDLRWEFVSDSAPRNMPLRLAPLSRPENKRTTIKGFASCILIPNNDINNENNNNNKIDCMSLNRSSFRFNNSLHGPVRPRHCYSQVSRLFVARREHPTTELQPTHRGRPDPASTRWRWEPERQR